MRGSIRTSGNGGAFSFTGFYHNKRLRSYRAYVTAPRRTVVLRYADRRVVLSPGAPGGLRKRPCAGQTSNTRLVLQITQTNLPNCI